VKKYLGVIGDLRRHAVWCSNLTSSDYSIPNFAAMKTVTRTSNSERAAPSPFLWFILLQCLKVLWYDIFANCNWVDTRWQQYSTHLHTNNT